MEAQVELRLVWQREDLIWGSRRCVVCVGALHVLAKVGVGCCKIHQNAWFLREFGVKKVGMSEISWQHQKAEVSNLRFKNKFRGLELPI